MDRSEKQQLIDICFELVLTATRYPMICEKNNDEKAAWVAKQLRDCGFETEPRGASWGILLN